MELLAPHVQVVSLVRPVFQLAELVRSKEKNVRLVMGKWESDEEAFNLILLCCGHAIALDRLARTSLSLQPSACVLARSAMESGARALWLLHPDNSFEREARWLAHLESEVGARKRMGVALHKDLGAELVHEFIANVRAKLPPGTGDPVKIPKFDSLLRSVGHPEKYVIYISLSQAAHATHYGAGAHRKNLGTEKVFGEFVTASDWWLPISTAWWFLVMPVMRLAEHYSSLGDDLASVQIQERFVRVQKTFQ